MKQPESGWRLAVAALALLVGACTGGGTATTTPLSSVPAATLPSPAAASGGPTRSPTVPPNAAPVELQGKWQTELAPGDVVILTIAATVYTLNRYGAGHSGRISVSGHSIEFSGVSGCPDPGRWTWSIDAGVLTFKPTAVPDPCPRYEALKGASYVRPS